MLRLFVKVPSSRAVVLSLLWMRLRVYLFVLFLLRVHRVCWPVLWRAVSAVAPGLHICCPIWSPGRSHSQRSLQSPAEYPSSAHPHRMLEVPTPKNSAESPTTEACGAVSVFPVEDRVAVGYHFVEELDTQCQNHTSSGIRPCCTSTSSDGPSCEEESWFGQFSELQLLPSLGTIVWIPPRSKNW